MNDCPSGVVMTALTENRAVSDQNSRYCVSTASECAPGNMIRKYQPLSTAVSFASSLNLLSAPQSYYAGDQHDRSDSYGPVENFVLYEWELGGYECVQCVIFVFEYWLLWPPR